VVQVRQVSLFNALLVVDCS